MAASIRWRPATVLLLVPLLLAGCGGPTVEMSVDGPEPGIIGTVRCVGPAVAGTTALPADVTQMSTETGLEFCVVGHGDATPPSGEGLVTAVEFTVQNPSTTQVTLPADAPVLQSATYGPAGVVAPQGRVLPETLGPRSSVTARVLYDFTAEQRSGVLLHWADLVVELAE